MVSIVALLSLHRSIFGRTILGGNFGLCTFDRMLYAEAKEVEEDTERASEREGGR